MFTLLYSICKYTSNVEKKVLVIGLDNAGKSTLVEAVKRCMYRGSQNDEIGSGILPTVGFNVSRVTLVDSCIDILFWDVGGQTLLRSLWSNYFRAADAVIYVIDSSDESRLNESIQLLHDTIRSNEWGAHPVPIVIVLNKSDLQGVSVRNLETRLINHNKELKPLNSTEGKLTDESKVRQTGLKDRERERDIVVTGANGAIAVDCLEKGKADVMSEIAPVAVASGPFVDSIRPISAKKLKGINLLISNLTFIWNQ